MIKLIQGDCLEKMKDIPAGSVDMVMADPPYGTTACKWDSIIPLDPMWEQLKRVIKPNGAIVMTASQPFTTTLIASNMKMFKYCWVWEKEQGTGQLNAKIMPLKSHEDVCVFAGGTIKAVTYNPVMTEAKPYSRNDKGKVNNVKEKVYGKSDGYSTTNVTTRYPKTIQKFNMAKQKGGHPTQKPVALMEYLIKTYTNERETVLDFTMGSGTTGVACVNLGRSFIGIEKDPEYFKIAEARIAHVQEEKAGMLNLNLS